jgi:hypothetical protein
MKGPYERLKFDFRRLWECPVCKRRERTDGSVTFRHCPCQMQKLDGKPVVMSLVADGAQRLGPPIKPIGKSREEKIEIMAPTETSETEAIKHELPSH